MAQGEWGATARLIEAALEILATEHPATVRQVFYRMVSVELIENTRAAYGRISRILTKARRDSRLPYEWIDDRTRPIYQPSVWSDPVDYVEAVKRGYRLDYWALQPDFVELWVEKDSIIGSIRPITDELGVAVRVRRGFMSATRVNEIAMHLVNVRAAQKYLFYLGDWDPSGENIEHVAVNLVRERAKELSKARSGDFRHASFSVERIAIHREDIKKFALAPLKIRTKEDGTFADSRARGFVKRHGAMCVELDSLAPSELRRRIRKAVMARMDKRAWARAIEIERVEIASILDLVDRWPGRRVETAGDGPK